MTRLQRGEPVEQELHVEADSGTRLIRATLNPVSDGGTGWHRITGIFEDITEHAAAADELRSREERFSVLAEGLAVGINLRQLHPPKFL